jgi:hypothetical protein
MTRAQCLQAQEAAKSQILAAHDRYTKVLLRKQLQCRIRRPRACIPRSPWQCNDVCADTLTRVLRPQPKP